MKHNPIKNLEAIIGSLQETEEGMLRGGFAVLLPSGGVAEAVENTAENCGCTNHCTTTTSAVNSGKNCQCTNYCRRGMQDDPAGLTSFTLSF